MPLSDHDDFAFLNDIANDAVSTQKNENDVIIDSLKNETIGKLINRIADFIGLPYFSGFQSGLKSPLLISHDFFSQSKFVPLPLDRAAMCSRPESKHQKNSVL